MVTPTEQKLYFWSLLQNKKYFDQFAAKALLLVSPTKLEIFWPDSAATALLLVTPTELELFWPDFAAKALILVTPIELEISRRFDREASECRAPS